MISDMAKQRTTVRIPKPAEILRERKRLGLTQFDAADKIGITQRAWLNYERGLRQPPAYIAILLRLLFAGKID